MLKTSQEDNEFFAEIDEVLKDELANALERAKAPSVIVYGIALGVPAVRPILTKYGLSEKFDLYIDCMGNRAKIQWLYDRLEIKPETHWFGPDGAFSNLEIFREAISQDTHTPDMKPIEIARSSKPTESEDSVQETGAPAKLLREFKSNKELERLEEQACEEILEIDSRDVDG